MTTTTRSSRRNTGKASGKRSWLAKLKKPLFVITMMAVLSLATLVSLAYGYYYWESAGRFITTRDKMISYLDQKYGREFTVENVYERNGGFGVQGTVTGDASPTDDKKLRFRVWEIAPNKGYTDMYLGTLWTRDDSEGIRNHVESLLGSDTEKISVFINPQPGLVAKLKGTPTFAEAKKTANHEIYVQVSVSEHGTFNDTTEQLYAKKLFTIAQDLKLDTAYIPSVDYAVFVTDSELNGAPAYSCNLDDKQIAGLETKDDISSQCFQRYNVRREN